MTWTMELACCESVLLNEISQKECKRADIAQTYAMAIASSEATNGLINWSTVNNAIVARWSKAGLKWIKERAWKIVERSTKAIREVVKEQTP